MGEKAGISEKSLGSYDTYLSWQVDQLVIDGQQVSRRVLIERLRSATLLSLREAKLVVDEFCSRHGVPLVPGKAPIGTLVWVALLTTLAFIGVYDVARWLFSVVVR